MGKLYLLIDVAKLLGKRPHQIVYAITSGLLLEPKMRIGGRRMFSDDDIKRIANYFGKKEARCHS